MYPLEKIRADFPFLQQKNSVIYLDNAAASQQPRCVIENTANKHPLSATDFATARHKVKTFINARCEQEIIFINSATEAISLVAEIYGQAFFKQGDEIVISAMEHQANSVPWQWLGLKLGVVLKIAPINQTGELIVSAFEKLLNHKTKLVALTHVSNVLGTINPIKQIIQIAHAKNIPVLIDGAQAMPHFTVDVQALDCDFYVFLGHKMYGSTGAGVLYVNSKLLDALAVCQFTDGDKAKLNFSNPKFASYKIAAPYLIDIVNLSVAMDYLTALGRDHIQNYQRDLFHYATEKARSIKGLQIIGQAAEKVPILSFVLDKIQPSDVENRLAQAGIQVRAGHHRAERLMKFYAIPATVRVSLAIYNSKQEIDVLMAAIEQINKR